MVIDNAKISSKIVGVIALLAIVMVVSIAFASPGMGRISANYADLSSSAFTTIWVTVIVALGGLVGAVCAGLWVASRGIAQPVHLLSVVMERFASNDREADVPGTRRGDELGAMARRAHTMSATAEISAQIGAVQTATAVEEQSAYLESEVSRFLSGVRTA